LVAKRQQGSPNRKPARFSTRPDRRDGLSLRAPGVRDVSDSDDDPVMPFRGDKGDETFCPADETIFAELRRRPEILGGYREWIESPNNGSAAMLAEKFLLMVESLIRAQGQSYPDGSTRVVSTSPHVPVQLPARNGK
jgi:hypothetical protein